MAKKEYKVKGFIFYDETDAKEAENELKGVEYMRSRIDMTNLEAALSSYKMMNDKKLFKTPVGYCFLSSLRENIINCGIDENDIDPVNIVITQGIKSVKEESKLVSKYKGRFVNMMILNVLLVLTLIVFAIIANNSDNINIVNYKNRIDAQYTQIEESLSQWSKELKEKEILLDKLEKELQK